jgi:chitinase
MKKIIVIVCLCFFSCATGEPNDNQPEEEVLRRPFVVAYLPAWKMPYSPPWDKITHLCLAFGIVQSDGSVDVTNVVQHKNIISVAQGNHVKVLLSIGGGGSNNFSTALLNVNSRTTLIANLERLVNEWNLDGIDLDYEEWDGGPDGASATDLRRREALEQTYRDLRGKIGAHKLITAAVTASWDNGQWGYYNCFNNTMHQYLDFISLMTYDETGPWASSKVGQHASWDFYVHAINHWLDNRKLPKEKLIAGVPFYGYWFKSPTNAEGAEGIAYRDILSQFPNSDAHLKDNIDLLYYNGMETIKQKAKYCKDNDLGGMMIWELSQDAGDVNKSLLNVIANEFKTP